MVPDEQSQEFIEMYQTFLVPHMLLILQARTKTPRYTIISKNNHKSDLLSFRISFDDQDSFSLLTEGTNTTSSFLVP